MYVYNLGLVVYIAIGRARVISIHIADADMASRVYASYSADHGARLRAVSGLCYRTFLRRWWTLRASLAKYHLSCICRARHCCVNSREM